ncbi:MAG: TonB-dependent receptor [Pyrinomonadaceae bacterium]
MKKILSISILLVLLNLAAFAQLSTVTLTGTVSGPDGVLPGASVAVKDNKTGKEITVTSGNDGQFKVPSLEVGAYTVTVTAAGFKTFNAQEVRLEVGKDYDLPVPLQVGGVSEIVTVTAGTDIVNTTDAQQNGIISNRQLEQLPLLTRNPLGFVPLQAGVASNPSQNSTINGVRTSGTNITIEGVNVQDNFIRANATDFSPARPLVDEVEEFTVTGQANVDRGFGAGQIQFPIRRGGNRYTGSVYDYNRNSRFGANSFFNNAGGVKRPFRNRNDFGGRFQGPLPFLNFGQGGPVVSSGKDKLFFFFFYQKTLDIIPSSDLNTVLTQQARNGQFTYTAAANDPANNIVAGQTVTVNLFNPTLGTGITGINPIIASRLLSQIPTGNSTDTGDGRVTTGYRFLQNSNAEQTNYTTRIDYNVNDRNSVKAIYRYVYQTVQRNDVDTGFNKNPVVDQPSNNPLLSIGVVSSFSSNFSNEIQGGFSFSNPFFLRNDGTPVNFLSSSLISNPEVTFLNQGRTAKAYNLQDNATYTIGNHGIRFGGQYQAIRINAFNFVGTSPTYTLGVGTNTPQISTAQFTNTALFPGTVPTSQRASANALLALLGGIVSGATQTFNATTQNQGYTPGASNARRFENENYGLYVSDQWRARKNLTINIGTRYDIYGAVRNPQGLFLEPIITDSNNPGASLLNPNGGYQFIGGNAGKANQFFKTDKNNFGPNLSFAYSPSSERGFGKYLLGENRTTIRGGFRISYINDEFVASANNAGVGNAGLSSSVNLVLNGSSSLNSRVNALPTIPAPPFVQTANRTFAVNNAQSGANFGTVYAIDPNVQTSSVKEYSLGIQRELGFNTALEVRYVGSHSGNLLRAIDLNQVNIRSNGFLADFNRARANFVLTGNAACTTAGCQPLTVFPNLAGGGLLTNSTITGQLVAGTPADLAIIYVQNGLTGTVPFLSNPNTGVVDYLSNLGRSNYNSLQVELRRRFAQGLQLQANYTFSKNLTNSQGAQTNGTGDTQNRFDPLLDNANPSLEYSRAITDQTHKFNLNAVYQLPFGKGKAFFNNSGIANTLLGGFVVGGILQIGSGSPITFIDARGTLNRAGRSNRQTALTNLTKQQLKDLTGVFRTQNGIFFINPTALGRDPVTGLLLTGRDGRGVSGNFDQAPFTGQVFFRNAPGQTSGLERAVVNGPAFYTLDMSLIKRFAFGERYSFQLEGDAFNILNTTNFAPSQSQDINSTSFGRITSAFSPRIVQLSARFNF